MLESKSQAVLSLQDQAFLYPIGMSFRKRLKEARKAVQPKVTQAAIAKALNVTPQAVSGWERGEAMPEPDKLVALSEMLKVDVGFLLGENKAQKSGTLPVNQSLIAAKSPQPKVANHSSVPSHSEETAVQIPATELLGQQDLPVFGTAEGGSGALIVTDRPVDWVIRPAPLLRVREGYGMIVTGDSMAPAVKSGSTVLVNPHLPHRAGDLCVFRSHLDDGTVLVCIKELRRYTDQAWHVRQLNPKRDFALKRSEWQICHVTVGNFYGR